MACNIRQNLIQTAVDRNLITARLTVLNKTELEKYNDNNDSVARNKYGVTAEGKPFIITSLDTVELNDPYLSELQTIVTNNNLDVTYDEAISEARNKILDDIRRFEPLSNFIKSYENDKIVLNDYAGRNGHLVNSAVNKFKKKYPAVKLYLDLFEKELKFAVPQTVFNQFFNSASTIKKDTEIKNGVPELFESNSGLANDVYSKLLTNSGISAENLSSLLLKDNVIEKQCS